MSAEMDSKRKLNRQGLWRTYSTPDGLSDLQTEHIVEDADGYLWFATWDGGACRFDGDEFRVFKQQDGLPSNHVNAVLVDRNGYLWFGTDRGVCWYDGRSFRVFEDGSDFARGYVEYLLEDRDGRIWAGGPRLVGYYDGERYRDLAPCYCRESGLEEPLWLHCWGMTEDAAGDMWLGLNCLVRYDGHQFHSYGAERGLRAGSFAMACDREGELWVACSNQVWRYRGDCFQPFSLGGEGSVRKIQVDREGRVWFCTSQGAYGYDGEELYHFTTRDGLAYDLVNAVHQDREGHLWFATWGGGISCYAPHSLWLLSERESPHRETCVLLEDRRGHIWMGFRTGIPTAFITEDCIARYDGERVEMWGGKHGLKPDNCLAICEDGRGRLWFGTRDGLLYYDGTWKAIGAEDGFEGSVVSAIAEDAVGNLYFGHVDPGRRHVVLSRHDGTAFHTLAQVENEHHNCISAIVAVREDEVWFSLSSWSALSRGRGIGRWKEGEEVEWYTPEQGLADDRVEDLCRDRRGVLWVATLGGLNRFDGKRFRTFTTEDGLPNNHVRGVYEDRRGHLWLATDAGVVCYDGRLFQTIRSPRTGPTHCVIEDRGGRYWFATLDGVVRYESSRVAPQVRILSITTDQIYPEADYLEVTTATRQVIFEYKGIGFRTHPRHMLYAFRLRGYEEEWRWVGQTRRAYYRDLPQGEYVFEVRAVDQDMNDSETARARLVVTADPHMEALAEALGGEGMGEGFLGKSGALHKVKVQVSEVATTDLTVLILGKTGTGKGLAARTIHRMSSYRSGPFIQVNCGAIPDSLVESELFGHERGAFTGAISRKIGKAELASAGTLFLDEVADLTPAAQVKLLRLLEERTFERVGGNETLRFNARVVAATNRNLEKMVAEGQFREDLYFRLQVFPIHLPPLCERREDIPLLAFYFMERMARHLNKEVSRLSPEAVSRLRAYDWPGNVRELEHTIQRAVIVCQGAAIEPGDLVLGAKEPEPGGRGELQSLEQIESAYIGQVLERTGWVISGPRGAAAILDLPESTLRNRMKKLGIRRP